MALRFSCETISLKAACAAVVLSAIGATGCSKTPPVAPVGGKVLYNGAPLPYGAIVFQPAKGQPGAGAIQPDGTFRLSTFREYDGAVPGTHKVSITCYTSQRPSEKAKGRVADQSIGELLIPSKYTYGDSSGLTAEVPAEGTDALVFEIAGPKRAFPK